MATLRLELENVVHMSHTYGCTLYNFFNGMYLCSSRMWLKVLVMAVDERGL